MNETIKFGGVGEEKKKLAKLLRHRKNEHKWNARYLNGFGGLDKGVREEQSKAVAYTLALVALSAAAGGWYAAT